MFRAFSDQQLILAVQRSFCLGLLYLASCHLLVQPSVSACPSAAAILLACACVARYPCQTLSTNSGHNFHFIVCKPGRTLVLPSVTSPPAPTPPSSLQGFTHTQNAMSQGLCGIAAQITCDRSNNFACTATPELYLGGYLAGYASYQILQV